MSTNYSIWPVVLIPYNVPPWKCMKQTNFILFTVIPGPRMTRNDIDICLQPLIAELKQLWEEGVETYDALKNEVFTMRATLLQTIGDFSWIEPYLGGTLTLDWLVHLVTLMQFCFVFLTVKNGVSWAIVVGCQEDTDLD